MITFALVIVYITLSYVAGWSCFISNNEGGFLPWICYMLSPITLPNYILICMVFILSRRL